MAPKASKKSIVDLGVGGDGIDDIALREDDAADNTREDGPIFRATKPDDESEPLLEADAFGGEKEGFNALFFSRFKKIRQIGFPNWCVGSGNSVCSIVMVIMLQVLSVVFIVSLGVAVLPPLLTAMHERDPIFWQFFIVGTLIIMIVATITTVGAFLTARIGVFWRRDLTLSLMERYFKNKVLYGVNCMDRDIDNTDQRIAAAVERAVTTLLMVFGIDMDVGTLYSVPSKILFIIIGLLVSLLAPVNLVGPLIFIFIFTFISVTVSTCCLFDPVVRYTFRQNGYEGNFRFRHARGRDYAESITFFNGEKAEEEACKLAFNDVYANWRKLVRQTTALNLFNLLNINWVTFGFSALTTLFIVAANPDVLKMSSVDRYVLLSQSVGGLGFISSSLISLPVAYGIVATVAGEIHRIGELMEGMVRFEGARKEFEAKGDISYDNTISVKDLTCKTPDGKTLYDNISLDIPQGTSIVIMGPSGCGKSSFLRILGGLWTFDSGTVVRPEKIGRGGIFFVPQRPYIAYMGSLKQQLIYPDTLEAADRVSDEAFLEILRMVSMDYLLKYGGLDFVCNWEERLSGGEQQRLGFARLFYHMPRYAVMDESTSALDVNVEDTCMRNCKSLGITCVSVAHRPTVIPFHDLIMKLDGKGKFEMEEVPDPVVDIQQRKRTFTAYERQVEAMTLEAQVDNTLAGAAQAAEASDQQDEIAKLGINGLCCSRFKVLFGLGFTSSCSKQAKTAYFCVFLSIVLAVAFSLVPLVVSANIQAQYSGSIPAMVNSTLVLIAFGIGLALVTTALFYFSQILLITWRRKVVNKVHGLYFSDKLLYTSNSLDKTLDSLDQRITDDVNQFASLLIEVCFLDKQANGPALIQLIIMVGILGGIAFSLVPSGIVGLVLTYQFATMFITTLLMTPVVSRLYLKNMKEGNFRFILARIREYAESITFFNGEKQQHSAALDSFAEVISASFNLIWSKIGLCFAFQLFAQIGTVLTYGLFALWYFDSIHDPYSWSERAGNPVEFPAGSSSTVVWGTNQTGNPIMVCVKNITAENKIECNMTFGDMNAYILYLASLSGVMAVIPSIFNKIAMVGGFVHRAGQMIDELGRMQKLRRDFDAKKLIKDSDTISVKDLTCKTPDGKTLYDNINIDIPQGNSIVIMGPSGCGKSSFLRILGGLWTFESGTVMRPEKIGRGGIFFVPQRPYIAYMGTLKDQIVYPETSNDYARQNLNDDKLVQILKDVKMDYLLERSKDGLAYKCNWEDMLSGGEQQRLGFARLFYHQPKYAIMDESTSALDIAVETACMQKCMDLGITCVSVAHRPSVVPFHKNIMKLDGKGSYTLLPVADLPADYFTAGH